MGFGELIMRSAHQEFDQLIHSLSILPDEIISDVIRTIYLFLSFLAPGGTFSVCTDTCSHGGLEVGYLLDDSYLVGGNQFAWNISGEFL